MSEGKACRKVAIPEELMLARLAQSEQMREFFIQMWLGNPLLAERVGGRLRGILSPLAVPTLSAGISASRAGKHQLLECTVERRNRRCE